MPCNYQGLKTAIERDLPDVVGKNSVFLRTGVHYVHQIIDPVAVSLIPETCHHVQKSKGVQIHRIS